MTKKIAFSALLIATTLASCGKTIFGEGDLMTNRYSVPTKISKIEVGSAIKLILTDEVEQGEVKIETHPNIFKYLDLESSSSTYSISLESNNYKNLDITVYASAAQYNSVEGRGASSITLMDAIVADTYEIDLSGASHFTMKEPFDNLYEIEIDASGASKATIIGSAKECDIDASGASKITANKFECDNLDVDLSGASDLSINIKDRVTGELTGASTLRYGGEPKIKIETSGASTVKPLN